MPAQSQKIVFAETSLNNTQKQIQNEFTTVSTLEPKGEVSKAASCLITATREAQDDVPTLFGQR
jgi:hypothetical protein